MRRMAKWGIGLLLGVAAFVGGAGAAWLSTGKATDVTGRGPGAWTTGAGTGGATASARLRATVARTGLWALPPSEVIYFLAERDEVGQALTTDCTYELVGTADLPARWWSIGAYVDYHWVPNPANRYSYTSSNITRTGDNRFVVRVGRDAQPGNWLPLGDKAGRPVSLLVRLYQPAPTVGHNPVDVPLPTLRRLSCTLPDT